MIAYMFIRFEDVFSIRFVHINSARFFIIDFDLRVDRMTYLALGASDVVG